MDGRAGGTVTVWVARDAEVGQRDAVCGLSAAWCGRECEEHGRHLVGARGGVFGYGGGYCRGLALMRRDEVVDALEEPGEGVDAHCSKKGFSCKSQDSLTLD